MDTEQCNKDVFEHGESMGLYDIPKEQANQICEKLSEAGEYQYDWHYIAGRVHLKRMRKVVVFSEQEVEDAFRAGWNACEFDHKRRSTVNGQWYAYRRKYKDA